jgi:hypothetical protein
MGQRSRIDLNLSMYRRATVDLPSGTMFTYQDLAGRYGLSYKQVRDRMTALGPQIEPFVEEGKKNTKLVNNSGLAIFDRLVQIERDDKLTIKAASAVLLRELDSNSNGSNNGATGEEFGVLKTLVDDQTNQIAKLHMQIEECRNRIGDLETQVTPMLPANVFKTWWNKLFHAKDDSSQPHVSN